MKTVKFFDTTLRDGEQTPGVSLNVKEKLEIARLLQKMGVDVIEAGFPASSHGDFEAVQAIAREAGENVTIAALARLVLPDIDRAAEAIAPARHGRIHVFIATSEVHMQYKLRMTREQVLESVKKCVAYAKQKCPDVQFSAEDASRSDRAFLVEVFEAAIEAGANVINIPDTVGYATPEEFGALVAYVRDHVRGIERAEIAVHCHNDLGLAVANTLVAAQNGATQLECTINGLGERAGNAALEEIVMGLQTRADYYAGRYDLTHRLDISRISRTSRVVSALTGVEVQQNKAIVGRNAFLHESGIHQHGVLAERTTYEIMTPESIGLVEDNMVLGKHSGRHAFDDKLRQMGYDLTPQERDQAFEQFKDLADKKRVVLDRDIEAILQSNIQVPPTFTLSHYQVSSGNKLFATASMSLDRDGETVRAAASADGPIQAAFNAIDKAVGCRFELETFSIRAVTEGADALGEVVVKLTLGDVSMIGRGLSVDIIEAAIRAYIGAVNRYFYEQKQRQSGAQA